MTDSLSLTSSFSNSSFIKTIHIPSPQASQWEDVSILTIDAFSSRLETMKQGGYTWASFHGDFKRAEQLYQIGCQSEELAASFAFQQFRILYHSLKTYDTYQAVEPLIEQFLLRFEGQPAISYLEYQACNTVYGPLLQWATTIPFHWVRSHERLVSHFVQVYSRLNQNLYWQPYEELLQTLLKPSQYLSQQDHLFFIKEKQQLLEDWQAFYDEMPGSIQTLYQEAHSTLTYLVGNRAAWNRKVLKDKLIKTETLLSQIDGKSLDLQQRIAVLSEEDQTLVLAGAGSGKTLTIAAKTKYLIEQEGYQPQEILLISFTNKSAEEMRERIQQKLGLDVEVKTFHKLGLDVLAQGYHEKPTVVQEKTLTQLIDQYLMDEIFSNGAHCEQLTRFFYHHLGLKEDTPLKGTLKEHYELKLLQKLKHLALDSFEDIEKIALQLSEGRRTLQQEYVKSMEEMKIANYLFLNGIRYEYEANYPFTTADEQHRQYKPDFYLPDYNLYLEHFGVRQNGKANWLPPQKASEYAEGIEWKRAIHRAHQTKMIETYSHQERNQTLLKTLRQQLEKEGVPFQHVDPFALLKRLMSLEKTEYHYFTQLIETFISFFKGNLYTLSTLEEWIRSTSDERTMYFYKLVYPLLERYEALLTSRKEVDFNDMIHQAIKLIQANEVSLPYRYIIVDEYQDISFARAKLLTSIQRQTQAKLFCVGDDWQSIYRFAGSDLTLFHQTGAQSQVLKLEQTYRNPQPLIDIAGAFIMKNPSQYQKQLNSKNKGHTQSPIQMYQYQKDPVGALKRAIADIVQQFSDQETIFLLGRYAKDLNLLDDSFLIEETPDGCRIQDTANPHLILQFLTVHKSKGMECDHVILLNAKDCKMGFPSQLEDDPILKQLLSAPEPYPFAEERRLFYVALTRAKKTCRILTPRRKPSCFIQELQHDHQVPIVWVEPHHVMHALPGQIKPVSQPIQPVSASAYSNQRKKA